MSSVASTENPTGSCVACLKEGATKRCRGCLDIGVDVFFCNRDCQLNHWKTHKAVCGKVSASDDSTPKTASSKEKRAKSLRKAVRETNQSLRICYNCMKTEKDVKLSSCSGCSSACSGAAYCSRECQKAHWPKHKQRCKQNSTMRQQMDHTLTPTEKNILNLLDQWKSNPVTVMGTLHSKCQQIMDIQECPPTKVMLVSLELDYNLKTFVFAEEPKIIPISKCPQECQDVLERMMSQGNEVQNFKYAFAQYAIITCKDVEINYQRITPMHFKEACLKTPMKELIKEEMLCKRVPLKSDLFNGWDAICKSNLKKQLDYLNKSPIYTGFFHNTMHLFNNKARLSLRGIVIYVKLGKDLGQITNFVKYQDMSQSDFKMVAEKADIFEIPPQMQQPVFVVVAYKNIETGTSIYLDRQICTLNKLGNRTTKRYKKDTDDSFKQLGGLVKQMPSDLVEKVSL
ncbi:hypothetical protein CTEN210_08822 [Chaetoceros tenuissimus]|uniref:MYND-type domain-containing protein n=1 Tax=Chaetoceros tenuissimus TaxID=426638 RepID=A0AAD3CU83_9STRA|nr:hypothetical protein CTEN210_08822 [Chaetoceros tenuissimus]